MMSLGKAQLNHSLLRHAWELLAFLRYLLMMACKRGSPVCQDFLFIRLNYNLDDCHSCVC